MNAQMDAQNQTARERPGNFWNGLESLRVFQVVFFLFFFHFFAELNETNENVFWNFCIPSWNLSGKFILEKYQNLIFFLSS